ncbi:ABC-three component system middle component 6 [Sporolactobacillus shoreicorticis]|uniref:ABC-three component system middle component 6 n=1 Tax=Sporolactobacillus shoreicorticis TaxID=1923877 RepID=A0ABW5RXM2_9BACL
MLVPTKNLHEDKSIIKIGARILLFMNSPQTVSSLWDQYKRFQEKNKCPNIKFDTFLLTLDFLYIVGAINQSKGILRRVRND